MKILNRIKYKSPRYEIPVTYGLTPLFLLLFNIIGPVVYSQDEGSFAGNSNTSSLKKGEQINYDEPSRVCNSCPEPVLHSTRISHTKSGSGFRIDSINQIKSDGYYDETRRWYYSYDASCNLDSISIYYFNHLGYFKHIREKYSFNISGQLIHYILRQFDPWRNYLFDSTMVDYEIKEYEYQGDFLVKKTTTTMESPYPDFREDFYFYDEKGRLVLDSITQYGRYDDCFRYYYNDEDELKYYVMSYSSMYIVLKFTYTETDTSRLITEDWVQYRSLPEFPVLDTISDWDYEKYFYEIFDERGRRTSLMLEQYGDYIVNGKIYKATFSWTGFDSLLHVSYFDWNDVSEPGVWQEAMRIDNTYDEYHNLLICEKTFFDTRTEFWELEDRKNYYYSLMPDGLPSEASVSENIFIFPNPAENNLNVILPFSGGYNYTIFNLYGIAISSGKMENQAINIADLKKGTYLVIFSNGHFLYSGKFVKLE